MPAAPTNKESASPERRRSASAPVRGERASTGVDGLDTILDGGYTPNRLYLLEGSPGTGKTTFALRFLMAGVEHGEKGLYITLSETAAELQSVVDSHGWSLEGVDVYELVDETGNDPDAEQSILYPSEVELGETVRSITAQIDRRNPSRVVFDSLSEMRLLAQDPLRYRRQILALKHFFATRPCTVLLLDDKTSDPGDLQLHSIAHGVVSLEQVVQEFGSERRRLRIVKMRGQKFQGGSHDFTIDTGRVAVFPRLVAARHRTVVRNPAVTTGLEELDKMLGGGLSPGTSTLFIGPSGIGKTTTTVHCMHAALRRGEKAVYYLFDEGISTLLIRSASLGLDLAPYLDGGQLDMVAIDPAELSPGEFACRVVDAVVKKGASFVAIDSLNAYLQAMSGQSLLLLHMHELLTFLSFQNVTTMLIVGQHGVVGNRSDLDLSYLSDAVVAFKFFEAAGALRSAITAVKSRTFENQRTIREFRLSREAGLQIGAPLVGFQGILGGLTEYRGVTELLTDDSR